MKEEIQQIPLDRIELRPQARTLFDEEKIEALSKSIETVGLEHPVSLYADRDVFGVIDGERRCRAFKLLGRKTIPAIVKDKPSAAELLLRQVSVDLQREDLNAMERASAIDRLMQATGWNGKEAAAKLAVSPAMVTRLTALLTLPEEIQQALKEGKIPASAGYELAKIDCATMRMELAQRLMAGTVTRDGVAGARKAAKRGKGETPVKRATAVLDGGRLVTVAAATLEDFISALESALKEARKGRTQGLALDTFLRLLKDKHEATI